MDDDFLRLKDAAAEFDVPRQRLYRLIESGKLATYRSERDNRARLVRRADVARLLRPRLEREDEQRERQDA